MELIRVHIDLAAFNGGKQPPKHASKRALCLLCVGVDQSELVHREEAKFHMANIDLVPKRHRRQKVAFDYICRKP